MLATCNNSDSSKRCRSVSPSTSSPEAYFHNNNNEASKTAGNTESLAVGGIKCLLSKYFNVPCPDTACKKVPVRWGNIDLAHCFGLEVPQHVTWDISKEYLCSHHHIVAQLYFLNRQHRYCAKCNSSLYAKHTHPIPNGSNLKAVNNNAKLCSQCYMVEIDKGENGTLFVLKGHNPIDSLHSLMSAQRTQQLQANAKIKELEKKLQSSEASASVKTNFTNILFEVAKKLNCEYIRKQCVKIKKKYTDNASGLDSIHLHDLLQDMDPVIWNFLVLITMNINDLNRLKENERSFDWSSHNLDFMKTGSDSEHRTFFRHLFLSYTLLFNMYNECGYPMHVIVAEIVSTYSQSQELISCLCKLGQSLHNRDSCIQLFKI